MPRVTVIILWDDFFKNEFINNSKAGNIIRYDVTIASNSKPVLNENLI